MNEMLLPENDKKFKSGYDGRFCAWETFTNQGDTNYRKWYRCRRRREWYKIKLQNSFTNADLQSRVLGTDRTTRKRAKNTFEIK